MNALAFQAVISGITLVLSVLVSAFVAGTRYGRIESMMQNNNERMARIEALFEYKLKDK